MGPIGDDQMVAHGHVRKDLDSLVRTTDAEAGALEGGHPVERDALELDVTGLGAKLPADAIEQGGLSRPVRPDEPDGLAPLHGERRRR